MVKRAFQSFLLICLFFCARSQQSNAIRFNFNDQFVNNPASTAPFLDLSISARHHRPFTGITNSPSLFYLAFQMPFRDWNMSIGGMIDNQSLGVLRETQALFSYAYKMKIQRSEGARKSYISYGLSARYNQLRINGASFTEAVDFNDPFINTASAFASGWNIGFGIVYSSQDRINRKRNTRFFQVGLSTSKALLSGRNIENIRYYEARIINAYSKYFFGEYTDLFVKAMLELTYEDSRLYDSILSATALWKESFITGLSFDMNGFLGFELGVETRGIIGLDQSNFRITINAGIPLITSVSQLNYGYGMKVVYLFDVENQ